MAAHTWGDSAVIWDEEDVTWSGTALSAGATQSYVHALNRLAGTTLLDAPVAANRWAGTTGLDQVAAINVACGTTRLDEMDAMNRKAGTVGRDLPAVAAILAN